MFLVLMLVWWEIWEFDFDCVYVVDFEIYDFIMFEVVDIFVGVV